MKKITLIGKIAFIGNETTTSEVIHREAEKIIKTQKLNNQIVPFDNEQKEKTKKILHIATPYKPYKSNYLLNPLPKQEEIILPIIDKPKSKFHK